MNFDGIYHDYCRTRIKFILSVLGHEFFANKTLLDLGGAQGDIGAAFGRLGSQVIIADARKELLKVAASKFPHVKTKVIDLDKSWDFRSIDIIISLDLISHLKNWQANLHNACNSAACLILSSTVLDSDNPNDFTQLGENKNIVNASYSGFASIPSAANIESILTECGMTFQRYDSPKLNSLTAIYDWELTNSKAVDARKHRFWIATKTGISPGKPAHQMVHNPLHHAEGMLTAPAFDPIPDYIPPLPSVAMPIYPDASSTTEPSVRQRQRVGMAPRLRHATPAPIEPALRYTTRLFFPYYDEADPKAKLNMDLAFRRNIDNLIVDLVMVGFDNKPTFNELFAKINVLAGDSDISIICNPNVFFDRTIAAAQSIGLKDVYALNAWLYNGGTPSPDTKSSKQVAWIVKGKVNGVNGDMVLGSDGADTMIGNAFTSAGYRITSSTGVMVYRVGDA
jgi:hypothetical protein